VIRDYALTRAHRLRLAGEPDTVLVHRADCPMARAHAAAGLEVVTMLGCEREPPAEWPRHDCLDDVRSEH